MTMRLTTLALLFLPMAMLHSRGSAEPGAADKPLRIVVFGGHPDDPESGAGGLIATLTQQGHEVIVAYGTAFRADRRFFDRPEAEVRRAEATAACQRLGATPKFFPYAHEKLMADEATLKAVSEWLGEVKPDIVVTHWPLDTHPNHHVVSSLVWQSYTHQGGWNLYFFEVMTGQQTLGFEPDLYLEIAGRCGRSSGRRSWNTRARSRRASGRPTSDAPAPGGRVRPRVRRGLQARRGEGRDARCCRSCSCRGKDPSRHRDQKRGPEDRDCVLRLRK